MLPEVDEYILKYGGPHQEKLHQLRYLMLDLNEHMKEKFSYKIPFYYYRNVYMVFFTVPAKRKDVLQLGFTKGSKMPNANGGLVGTGKVVRHFEIHKDEEIDFESLAELLEESMIIIDKEVAAKKNKK